MFYPFCFFFALQQPVITLLLILYFKEFFKQIHGWDLWTLDKQISLLLLAGERERKKGGSKEGEWEMGEALAAWKQSWCCWFHWVYWERRAARVTSANNTELQSQEVCVCVWIHLWGLRFPSFIFFFCLLLGLKRFQTRQKIVLLFTVHSVILIFSILSASSVVYSCSLSVCQTLRHFVINLDNQVIVNVINHWTKLIIHCFSPLKVWGKVLFSVWYHCKWSSYQCWSADHTE